MVLFALFGFLLAITQTLGQSPDYSDYDIFLNLVRSERLNVIAVSRFEPGFSILAIFLTNLFTTNLIIYGWIVVAAMLFKGWAIAAYSSNKTIFFAVAVFYFSRYYPLHELTQLRAACAIALVLVGSIFIWKRSFLCSTVFFILSFLFHVSVPAIIPALLTTTPKRSRIIFIALAIFILTSVISELVVDYLVGYIEILDSYQTHGFSDVRPNPFAIQLLIDWMMIIISLVIWSRLTLLMKRIF
jgi:hypothetical protein